MARYSLKALEAIGIDRDMQAELAAFCRQYWAKRAKIGEISLLSSARITGMPSGAGAGDPVAKAAERLELYRADISMIDRCLDIAAQGYGAEVRRALLLNVTGRNSFARIAPPISINTFTRLRVIFFTSLARSMGKI